MEDYYCLLGVSKNASTDDIKKAFRKRIKEIHPDISKSGDKEGTQKLIEAYKVLTNPELRKIYDKKLELYEKKEDKIDQKKLLEMVISHFTWREQALFVFSLSLNLVADVLVIISVLLALSRNYLETTLFLPFIALTKLLEIYIKRYLKEYIRLVIKVYGIGKVMKPIISLDAGGIALLIIFLIIYAVSENILISVIISSIMLFFFSKVFLGILIKLEEPGSS